MSELTVSEWKEIVTALFYLRNMGVYEIEISDKTISKVDNFYHTMKKEEKEEDTGCTNCGKNKPPHEEIKYFCSVKCSAEYKEKEDN